LTRIAQKFRPKAARLPYGRPRRAFWSDYFLKKGPQAYDHVISDQYSMARRSGFDDVEVSKALATRQPEAEWLFRSNWSAHDYQTRLRKSA
jgi:hypothetical protein